jgi:molybdate/tungstate transport system substrate-binding protein
MKRPGTGAAIRRATATLGLSLAMVVTAFAQARPEPLVVFNAGSLGVPFRALLGAFERETGTRTRQESAGSLELARRLTELGRIPDVLAVADRQVLTSLIIPGHASWYATFAGNAMVLIHSDRSAGAAEIGPANWWSILLRPGVRTGRSDPSLDPNGYRTLMVTQLAERHYRQPGLAARLAAAMPARYVRPKEADLVALVQAGELDYAWSYRSIAATTGLRSVALPPEIDLSDPARAEDYGRAGLRVPGPRLGADSVTITGEPIEYALTIPTRAANPTGGAAFVRFLYSPAGQAILARHGFTLPDHPRAGGPGSSPAGVLPQTTVSFTR